MKRFKQRKLRDDQSENIWYAVEQYNERTEQNIGTRIDNGPPAVMKTRLKWKLDWYTLTKQSAH